MRLRDLQPVHQGNDVRRHVAQGIGDLGFLTGFELLPQPGEIGRREVVQMR